MIKLNSKMMKNNFLLGLAIAATVFTSCGEQDVAGVTINDNSVVNNTTTQGGTTDNGDAAKNVTLAGTKAEDLVIRAKDNNELTGALVMTAGTTLKIEAGAVIKAQKGPGVYIAIAQGAKIIAEGTANNPIVLTSGAATPKAGDWGGLILLGKAPINSVADLASQAATSEIANLPYGGTDANDNSGVLKYMRVEYSGGKVDGQTENNGYSFYGVGNGTTVQYVQMYEGLDDGLEFYGGTVNASFVSVINSEDDSIDWTEGWAGTLTDVYVKHARSPHDKAFECDGYNTDIGNNSNPKVWSNPTVKNVTIIGLGSANSKEAIRLRAGTQAKFDNVMITGYAEGFDIDGNDTANPTASHVTAGTLKATNVKFTDVTTKVKKEDGVTYTDADFVTEGEATGTDYATWGSGWTKE